MMKVHSFNTKQKDYLLVLLAKIYYKYDTHLKKNKTLAQINMCFRP